VVTSTIELPALTVGFHAEIVPPSVAKMNRAGFEGGGPGVKKKVFALKTLLSPLNT